MHHGRRLSGPLAGRHVLLTRPAGAAEAMARRLRQLGARVSLFPALRIVPEEPGAAALARLRRADLALFVSVNAVQCLRPRLGDDPAGALPAVRGAVGAATARALRDIGCAATLTARRPYSSEALLQAPELQDLAGKTAVIVRGAGGREVLARELARRGAAVHYAETYRREPTAAMLSLRSLRHGRVEAVCLASAETAACLRERTRPEERAALLDCPVIAGSERIAAACRELGYRRIAAVAEEPGDDAMCAALTEHFDRAPV